MLQQWHFPVAYSQVERKSDLDYQLRQIHLDLDFAKLLCQNQSLESQLNLICELGKSCQWNLQYLTIVHLQLARILKYQMVKLGCDVKRLDVRLPLTHPPDPGRLRECRYQRNNLLLHQLQLNLQNGVWHLYLIERSQHHVPADLHLILHELADAQLCHLL